MTDMRRQARTGERITTIYWIVPCVLVLLVLASAGCLGTRLSEPSTPVPPAVIVDYHRTGGIAGTDDRLVVFDNGVAVISGRSGSTEILLNQTDLALISVLFNQSQFSQLQAQYSAPGGRADLMTYTISYHGKTVTAEESAVPPSLLPVIADLNHIVSAAGVQRTSYPTLPVTPA
jgi:hypothetical protein